MVAIVYPRKLERWTSHTASMQMLISITPVLVAINDCVKFCWPDYIIQVAGEISKIMLQHFQK